MKKTFNCNTITRKLTIKEDQLVKRTLEIKSGILLTAFSVDLQASDIERLLPGIWLNCEIINFYGQLIMKRSKEFSFEMIYPNVLVFNSCFYQFYKNGGFDQIKRWTKNV